MKLHHWIIIVLVFVWMGSSARLIQAQTGKETEAPPYQEIFGLIRSNLTEISEAELNRAATFGLLAQLGSQVTLVTNEPAGGEAESPAVSKTEVYENAFAYLRVARVGSGLPNAISESFERLKAAHKLTGLVLDLRFAGGLDYAAAAGAAARFLSTAQPLLRWGNQLEHSIAKTNAIKLPVAVLVNRRTSGAAEALAAIMRQAGVGLLIGNPTAGEAHIFQEFSLRNGQRLRIAKERVQLPDDHPLPAAGIPPDIAVAVSLEEEKAYGENAFKDISKLPGSLAMLGANATSGSSTNPYSRRGMNEAELVRRHREGIDMDAETKNPDADARPVIRDPVLARSIDFLKGLAVVQQLRSL